MRRRVFCQKLGIEAEGLKAAPYPGPLGQMVYEHISQKAWDMWLQHQTMLINEYRLNPLDKESRKFLETEMEKFFFGTGSEKPPGYSEG